MIRYCEKYVKSFRNVIEFRLLTLLKQDQSGSNANILKEADKLCWLLAWRIGLPIIVSLKVPLYLSAHTYLYRKIFLYNSFQVVNTQ